MQNANFHRNYLSLITRRNMRHILAGTAAALKRPLQTAKAFLTFLRVKNTDVLILYFYKVYQIDYIRRHRGFRAPRAATVFTDVNPNYVR